MTLTGEAFRLAPLTKRFEKARIQVGTQLDVLLHPLAELVRGGAVTIPTYFVNNRRKEGRNLRVSGTVYHFDDELLQLVPVWDTEKGHTDDVYHIGGIHLQAEAVAGWRINATYIPGEKKQL